MNTASAFRHSLNFIIILSVSTFFIHSLQAKDHSNFFQETFDTGKQVTERCLQCHQAEGISFMQSVHWTWESEQSTIPGHTEPVSLGKKSVLNNFCIGLKTNYPRCTSCHAGYGWEDASFDFEDPKNIDCLVCHDNTGTYSKTPTGAGMPADDVDLLNVAKNVGPTTRKTCGSCHFYGGGGNNIKHGDLENALISPDRNLDVHMGGADMTCTDCHITNDHNIQGNALSVSTFSPRTVACENCHSEQPHISMKETLDRHAKKVACQSCHIPEFARANPTKMSWDWSTAGEDRSNIPEQYGQHTYNKMKGTFTWGKNVVPEYRWYNGESIHMLTGDKLNPSGPTAITEPMGSRMDPNSKLHPFKVHTGKQIADSENEYLLPTHLFGGYWKHYDWEKSVTTGTEAYGLDYSGSYYFAETVMYWKINHMVAPKEESLGCGDCHTGSDESRMDWKALGYTNGDPMMNQ